MSAGIYHLGCSTCIHYHVMKEMAVPGGQEEKYLKNLHPGEECSAKRNIRKTSQAHGFVTALCREDAPIRVEIFHSAITFLDQRTNIEEDETIKICVFPSVCLFSISGDSNKLLCLHTRTFRINLLLVRTSINLNREAQTIFYYISSFFNLLLNNNVSQCCIGYWISIMVYRAWLIKRNKICIPSFCLKVMK